MMRTVSLRTRVVAGGSLVLVVLLIALDALVYLGLRDQLYDGINQLLSDRARLAQELQDELSDEELAGHLGDGLVGVEVGPPGSTTRIVPPQTPAPNVEAPDTGPIVTYQVILTGGRQLTLTASAAAAEASLRRLLVVEIFGTLAALAIGVVAFDRATTRALRPIDDVVTTARRTAAGRTGERLRPDRTDTELGRMASAFDEMLDGLEAAIDSSRAAEARTRRFLADVAHQLRTPLAGIQASAEALLRGTGDQQRLLANLARETSRAGNLLSSLLRVARLDSSPVLSSRPTDLLSLCRHEAARAQVRSPHLLIEVDGDQPGAIDVDPDEVGEAVGNLVDNATRHAVTRVGIRLRNDEAGVAIEVSDDGPGLAPDSVEQAFARFVSLDSAGGSGLGLPIARGIARAHGGELEYRDGCFRLSLPNQPPAKEPPPRP